MKFILRENSSATASYGIKIVLESCVVLFFIWHFGYLSNSNIKKACLIYQTGFLLFSIVSWLNIS